MRLGDGGQAREPDICKNAPQYLRALSARSGDEWTPDEIQQMMRWWYEPPQQRRVLQYAVLFLGAGVTLQVLPAWSNLLLQLPYHHLL